MVVLTFHVGALAYFNTSKCSHASLHPGKAGSCEQLLGLSLRFCTFASTFASTLSDYFKLFPVYFLFRARALGQGIQLQVFSTVQTSVVFLAASLAQHHGEIAS